MTCSNWNEALNIHQISLNVTGSFVNGIICVVSSVGIAPIYGLLLAKKVLEIIRHLIAAEKLSFAYNNKVQQYLTQIYFPEGTQPGWKFAEIPGGEGGGEGYSAVARPNGQLRQAGVARGVRGHAPGPPPRNFEL